MTRLNRGVILGLLALMLAWVSVIQATVAPARSKWTVEHGRCFSLDDWGGGGVPDSKRPCVSVRRVYEDGSFKFAVLDASGKLRYVRSYGVPNSYERSVR